MGGGTRKGIGSSGGCSSHPKEVEQGRVRSSSCVWALVDCGGVLVAAEAVVYDQPTLHSCSLPFFVRGAFL